MTSTIKVDNIQDQDGNNIINESSNTITVGASGDTIIIPSGATITNNGTQNGFGRTGTVDWQTSSIKTATFTAANGEGYFCNTTSSAFTMNLPAGSAGAIVSVQDYNNTFDSNALTISPNGAEKINGSSGSVILDTEGEGLTLVYIDSTIGWRSIQDSSFSDTGSAYISATGGTITTSGDFKIHTFTGPGTFQILGAGAAPGPASSNVFDYLVVAGGGAGGPAAPSNGAGGGGAGGYRESSGAASGCYTVSPRGACVSGKTAVAGSYPITVGGGGTAPPSAYPNPTKAAGNPGSNSVLGFSPAPITSAGGGGGGLGQPNSSYAGQPGGSGGGGGGYATGGNTAGTGNTPPVTPAQGSNGGQGSTPTQGPTGFRGGGGGGATAVGTDGGPGGANGGAGGTSSINATPTARAGGGGGGCTNGSLYNAGSGGAGGGGDGGAGPGNTADAGTVNTGGGGGGGGFPQSPTAVIPGGAGGSGIVIIRYKFQ